MEDSQKLVFDLLFAIIGFIFMIPIILIITIIIKLTSKGPVFYIAPRVGKNGKLFNMIKFRSMYVNADKKDEGSVTVKGDRRVSSIGKFLRKYKLDELPELLNILKGNMSFVGPRPDVPGYADHLKGDDRRVLELRPGITGPATLKYSNEELLLSKVEDPQKYNDEVIFPDKVKINLEYMDSWSLWLDIKIIFRTIFRKNY
jgi:lipopolysaccharide/colanic/teichoic acid biosynthesis glycosyltransferase